MSIRVNPDLPQELRHYGKGDWNECFHCGNCTAVCPLTANGELFPRKVIRHLQMGLTDRLAGSLEPWLCYYCGECSEKCPRGAEPGELMMTLRRWLIGRYDFTGAAGAFFKSTKLEVLAVVLAAILSGAFFLAYGFTRGDIHVYDGAGAFLPSAFIHFFDLGLGAVLGSMLAINVFRMWRLCLGGARVPLWRYVQKFYLFPWHFFSQKRYSQCENPEGRGYGMPWFIHLGLMLGYVTMLVLVMVFIHWLQAGPEINWFVHAFGYAATLGLAVGCIYFLRRRLKKTEEQYQHSHGSDWVFVILLCLIVATGVLQHVLHRTGLPAAANVAYVLHLMCVVPWLLRMPFSKWSHLVYRPMAMYFAGLKNAAGSGK